MRGFVSPVAPQPFPRFHHEGPVLPQVGEGPPPRLQGRASPRQGLRDLQVQPAFQGAPALIAAPGHRPGPALQDRRGRSDAALFVAWLLPVNPLPAIRCRKARPAPLSAPGHSGRGPNLLKPAGATRPDRPTEPSTMRLIPSLALSVLL